ncbi:HAD-IC family P-type ATPase [Leptolyngbya sp. NK1-12]|uniref:HAD-IC family P-type ATPase n=1 Tax=Leptolyngbya sp. NK1-12 TaxID=2547451 RepID=A0AA96WHS0_9CYAN|nr:HAD-IC family P-type ATPase [Leptolyngbya sp. NK1-12]WNZ21551.1 HAD-IC family P-type ATPase [Leptolyngbya sp. NK1-12]
MQTVPTHLQGLSHSEVAKRRAAGQGNDVPIQTSRTYWDIFRDNLFTFINWVYFFLSLVLIALGRASDVLVLAFVVLLNVVINVIQEIRAKQKLDKIALITRPKASVIRDGQEQEIDPSEIVVGDVLMVRPGDQIVVDGSIVGEGEIKVDESLLTGESDLIPKQSGNLVYSGSFCVSGAACYEAEKVGAESLASKMTAEARKFRKVLTPLQHRINLMIRLLLGVAIVLGFVTVLRMTLGVTSITTGVQNLAVIVGLVPIGLYFMITLAYALGAVRIAEQSALVQQSNAVESISNVDVMCLDKTGTLTTNRINLQTVYPIGIDQAKLEAILGDFAASASTSNKTNDAIIAALPRAKRPVKVEVPFGSAHKWSAVGFADAPGLYVLGAPEILGTVMPLSAEQQASIREAADRGLRVLMIAHSPTVPDLYDGAGDPVLPATLQPLGILQFGDELRPDARQTLTEFQQAGIQVKVISGDNPLTVAALAKQAGLSDDIIAVSGQELAQMDDAVFTQTAEDSTIFGRITPEQKARLVQSLQLRGHYVAMMGDGVNDVLSLKQANVGVAMESGSQATRGVADIVLLKDTFSALPKIFLEGQRIRNGVADISKLFMVRIFSFILAIIAIGMITLSFPFGIKTSTIVTFLTVGIPPFFVTLWAKPDKPRGGQGNPFMHFVLPAMFTLSIASILIYLFFLAENIGPVFDWLNGRIPFEELGRRITRADIARAQRVAETAMVTMQVLGGLLLLPFLKPPTPAWVGGEPLSRDWRYTILASLVLAGYIVILAVPALRRFFELSQLDFTDYLGIGLVAVLWALVVRFVWRNSLLDRFLDTKISPF